MHIKGVFGWPILLPTLLFGMRPNYYSDLSSAAKVKSAAVTREPWETG